MRLTAPPGFAGPFRSDDDACAAYSESAGILRAMPCAVALPASAEDLRCLCAWAAREGIGLVPRGSGSSMSGAAVGEGLVIVDMHRFRSVGTVDRAWGRVAAGAAVTRSRVDSAARQEGLRFPVDPSSGAFATIGGMTATNAAGPRSLSFGAMRPWVHAIECVFADGAFARVSRDHVPRDGSALTRWHAAQGDLRERCAGISRRDVRKDSSGYGIHDFAGTGSLVDLLVGSEGTLAFFTSVELELVPLPASTASLLASWPTLEGAMRGADVAREAGAVACELLDATFLRVAARGRTLPVPHDAECVLLVELEDREPGFSAVRADVLAAAWRRTGAGTVLLGLDDESEEALWALRHAASPILSRMDPHVRSMQLVEDGCVPPHRLPEYVRGVREALAAEGLEGVLFGHAGDAHVHVNALVDVRREGWRRAIRGLFDRVTDLTVRLGGTMAGEHGDGRLRSAVLGRFWSQEAMAIFGQLKAIFDPAHQLNPGVKVGPAADPLAHVKYDPDTPLGSTRAARVLDRVEGAREYDSCRLEMLDVTG